MGDNTLADQVAGMKELAFVRSPLAHARVIGVRKPPGREADVFTAADLDGVRPILAASRLPGFKVSSQPALAQDKCEITPVSGRHDPAPPHARTGE